MPRAISPDLRQRIFDTVQSGESCTEAAERFEVSSAFVRRLVQHHRETDSLAPKVKAPRPFQLADRADEIEKLLSDHPGLTAGEVHRRLGVDCCVNTVWRMIRRLGNSFKKKPPGR